MKSNPAEQETTSATLVYDGDCRFCCLWVARWQASAGSGLDFVPCKEAEIPREECEDAVQWLGKDGSRASGAEAVFRVLASGSFAGKLLLLAFQKIPPWAAFCDFAYGRVAKSRWIFSWLTALLWGADVRRPEFSLAAWLFLRGLAIVYLIAFGSFWVQAQGLIGEQGILPAEDFFNQVREQLGPSGFWQVPSLLWLGANDMALAGWCAAGVAASIFVLMGFAQAPCLAISWALYLSLCVGGQGFYLFQWDSLLIETGFLAIFLAPWRLGRSPVVHPPRIARLLLIWLLFRLIFSSGVAKLSSGDPAWWPDWTALDFHYFTQPLPSPLAWFAQQLPSSVQKVSVLGMFGIELLLPFFLFAPRRLRHATAAGLMTLQLLILLTGNYGFFNLLTIVLCLLALDDSLLRGLFPHRIASPAARRTPRALDWMLLPLAAAVFTLSLIPFLIVFRKPISWFEPLRPAYELIHPFRTINSYGLFATMTKERREILVQGSEDGFTWETYPFRFKPGDVHRAPPVVAPYMPRLDWQMWFAALGSPSNNPWFANFCQQLLLAEPRVLALLEADPFNGRRPKFIRAYTDSYRFTTWDEKQASGDWWVAEPLGIYLPEVTLHPSKR